jgi:hypothetical protein
MQKDTNGQVFHDSNGLINLWIVKSKFFLSYGFCATVNVDEHTIHATAGRRA